MFAWFYLSKLNAILIFYTDLVLGEEDTKIVLYDIFYSHEKQCKNKNNDVQAQWNNVFLLLKVVAYVGLWVLLNFQLF